MKRLTLSLVLITMLLAATSLLRAEEELTGTTYAGSMLDDQVIIDFFAAINTHIDTALADNRLTNQITRQLLTQSRTVISEMLTNKDCSNVEQLVELAKWMKAQSAEAVAIREAGEPQTLQQQFVTENPLKVGWEGLTLRLDGILTAYVLIDGSETAPAKLEGYFQLYLHFVDDLEVDASGTPDFLLLKAPEWMKTRFIQLPPEKKREVLDDINDARQSRTELPVEDGTVQGDPPSPEEEAAYDAAYAFIVNNTPAP